MPVSHSATDGALLARVIDADEGHPG
jgi:hypothetical protein